MCEALGVMKDFEIAVAENSVQEKDGVDGYLPEFEINKNYARLHPNNCAVREKTADGDYVGPCEYYLRDGVCPRHGKVKIGESFS